MRTLVLTVGEVQTQVYSLPHLAFAATIFTLLPRNQVLTKNLVSYYERPRKHASCLRRTDFFTYWLHMRKTQFSKPHGTIVLAMSADGKISDVRREPARFGSAADKAHLEKQIAIADGVLLGAGTLRAYGTTMRIANPKLLQQLQADGKPPQPVQILVSQSGNIDSSLRFFQQPVPRWLLTTAAGAQHWHSDRDLPGVTNSTGSEFEKIIIAKMGNQGIDWVEAFRQLAQLELKRLAILGGGELVASLLAADVIDELCLTVCPLILGGAAAPTPVDGAGLLSALHLDLLSVDTIEQEVFLHYRIKRAATNIKHLE